MRIKKKDIFLLEIIEKLTVVSSTNLTILAGYHDVSVIRKRLRQLIADGYVDERWFDKEKLYFLTGKGLAEIEISRKPYEIKGFSTEHFSEVSAAATWLYIKTRTSIYDMAFEKDMKKAEKDGRYRLSHMPDIIFSHKAIEVELNSKAYSRLEDNFCSNANNFTQQIWILPEHLNRISERIKELAKKENSKVYIITLEQMHEQIKAYNLKNNCPRENPIRSIEPAPISNERNIILDV